MEEQNDQEIQDKPRGQKIHLNKRLIIIIGSIFVVLILIFSVIILQGTSGGGSSTSPSLTPDQNVSNTPQAGKRKPNPLINPAEIDKVESAIRKKMEESGVTISPKPDYKFQYQLAPELQGKSSSLLIQSAYAANTCNIPSAPSTLPLYTLKNHVNLIDAKAIASQYNINSDPSGIVSPDGSSFDYFFSDAVISQFLQISEPSATTYWHRVIKKDPLVDIGAGKAQDIAQQELQKYSLQDKVVLKNSGIDPITDNYLSHYEKNYDNWIMTDKSALLALGDSTSVCSVGSTKLMNYIDILVTKNGYSQKIMNKTRKITASYTAKRATLQESLDEYQANPPIDPIVIGGSDSTGKVTIDEAVLVWYDYGPSFPQTAYIPMYLTSGKTSTGARVLTLFPAVSMQELNNTPIPDLSGSRDVLQLYTFNPAPANKPPAPKNPLTGTPYPTIPGLPPISGFPLFPGFPIFPISGFPQLPGVTLGPPGTQTGACWGGLVDYDVDCRDSSGSLICSGFVSIETDESGKNDPWGVCKNGCQTKSATITAPAGSNPCIEYLKQNNIKFDPRMFPGSLKYNGQPVQCRVNGCPC